MRSFLISLLLFFNILTSKDSMAQETFEIKWQVIDSDSKEPLVGVTASLVGTNKGEVSDVLGNFTLTGVRKGTTVKLRYLGYESRTLIIENREERQVTMSSSREYLENLVVIGTRGAHRSKLETAVPIDVLPMSTLGTKIPQIEVTQALHYFAPSFNSNQTSLADGTDHVDPASLRGLGPDQVLVLVNGKRRHPSSLVNLNSSLGRGAAGTDLNAIPMESIKRIEILRDGASAQYGSDAISGVINVILKSNREEELKLSLTSGVYKEGDGETYQFTTNYNNPLNGNGFVNVTGNVRYRGAINRSGEYNGKIYVPGGGYTSESERVQDEDSMRINGTDRSDFNMKIGGAELLNAGFMVNAQYSIDDQTNIYAFGGAGLRNGRAAGFYRLPTDSRNIKRVYPNGYLPEIHTDILDRSIHIGIETKLDNWNFDFSLGYGGNSFKYKVHNSINASLLERSPSSFDSGGFRFNQNTGNIDVSRFYQNTLEGVNIAFGGEFRTDNYRIIRGEESSWRNYGLVNTLDTLSDGTIYVADNRIDLLNKPGGAQGFPGFRPENEVNRTRTNVAGYIDLELDLTSDVFVSISARGENYSDFGSTVNGKLAARYQVLPYLAF